MKKYVAANADSVQAIGLSATNYRAHLTRGRALSRMLLGKAASTANAERGEQARYAFASALKDAGLSGEERAEIQAEAEQMNGQLVQLNPACAQQ